MGHKLLSASSSPRWGGEEGCVASVVLQLLCPEREAGASAELGTEVHEYCEDVLNGKRPKAPKGMLAEKRIHDTAKKYIAYVKSKQKLGLEVVLENKLTYSVLHGGTADADIEDEMMGVIEIVDLKTGKFGVTPRSRQIGIYLVSKRHMMGKNARNYRYLGTIVQEGVQTEEWTHEELDAVEADMTLKEKIVVSILTGVVSVYDYAVESESNCQWCAAKGICEAYQKAPFERVPKSVKGFAKGKVGVPKAAFIPKEERAAIVLAKPKITKWLNEVEKGAVKEALLGVEFPGLQMGQKKQGNRAWNKDEYDTNDLVKALVEIEGVTEDQLFTEAELKSPAQIEKLGVPVDVLDKLTSRSEGKAALVPAVDNNANFE